MKVKKRNGKIEDYKEEKIAKVVAAAGLKKDEAKKLASEMTIWVKSKNENPITSLTLRDKIIIELKKINKRAADFFIWYEKNKEKNNN